jgi:predicted N-acyltransferase
MINFFNEESYNVMDFLLAISSRKRKKLQHNNVMDFLLAISSRKRKKLQHRNEIL